MIPFNRNILTLDEFTIQQLRQFPQATGELSSLLRDIGLAAKRVNVEVNKAGLVDILGDAGTINVQGEDVKKLDVFANNQFMGVLQHGVSCAGIGSEELPEFVSFDDDVSKNSKYVVCSIRWMEVGTLMSIFLLVLSSEFTAVFQTGVHWPSVKIFCRKEGTRLLQGILFMDHQPCWCMQHAEV